MSTDTIQIHFLKPYPASCLVRGRDGRPKMLEYGGCDRARISSASMKRAIRTSDVFVDRFQAEDHLGERTRRIGNAIVERLAGDGLAEGVVRAALGPVLAGFGKPDPTKPGAIRQLAFIAPEEMQRAADLVRAAIADPAQQPIELDGPLLAPVVKAVDIALFGRMLADEAATLRMTAAAEVAHPFSVGRAAIEADFYVAVDDRQQDEDSAASGFMGDAFFTAGLFYGYARIDVDQLTRNLGGDADLAEHAAAACIEAVAIVSPAGKRASFGTHSKAPWMMVERGTCAPTSLAAAFLRPVQSGDQLADAKTRLLALAEGFDRVYGTTWQRAVMDVDAPESATLAELAAIASHAPAARPAKAR